MTATEPAADVYDHPEFLAFVRAMRESPADDTVRLACADWLQERGEDARAEFIRVQVRIAQQHICECAPALFVKPRCRTCVAVKPSRNRQNALLTKTCDQFRPDVPHSWGVVAGQNGTSDGPISWVWRGFVASVTCSAADWLQHADAILARHPVERVELTTLPQIENDPGEAMWLKGDSRRSAFTIFDVFDEICRMSPHGTQGVDATVVPAALLRLRWPGVTFTLPGA